MDDQAIAVETQIAEFQRTMRETAGHLQDFLTVLEPLVQLADLIAEYRPSADAPYQPIENFGIGLTNYANVIDQQAATSDEPDRSRLSKLAADLRAMAVTEDHNGRCG